MLSRRLFSAAIIVSLMIFLTWLDFYLGKADVTGRPGLVLAVLAIFVSIAAIGELVSMWRTETLKLKQSVATFCGLVLGVFAMAPIFIELPMDCPIGNFGWPWIGFVCAVGTAFAYEMKFSDLDRPAVERLSFYVLAIGYVSIFVAFIAAHRLLDRDNLLGIFSIVTLITTVKLSDSFAYFIGKSFGKHKLAPRLSPGKTIQGGLGAILGGVLGALLMFYVLAPYLYQLEIDKSFLWVMAYGVVLTIAGMFGDLAESFLKRTAECKDSSSWFPGLGGVLDVADSLIATAPVSFLMWLI